MSRRYVILGSGFTNMDLKEFAQYLKQTSFDTALHHVRKLSFERILANESPSFTRMPYAHHDHKQAKKTA